MKKEGEALKIYIEGKAINRTKLAKALGMSRTNLYQFFKTSKFDQDTKNKICKYLQVSFDNIYNYIPKIKPEFSPAPESARDEVSKIYDIQKNNPLHVQSLYDLISSKDIIISLKDKIINMLEAELQALKKQQETSFTNKV